MAPKKTKKVLSLNEFLGDSSLGSWADEMDSLPTAPAPRLDDDRNRNSDRFSRRDDYLSSRPDRVPAQPRDDLPLPTNPPFTAFIGNLAFDLTEADLEDFFAPAKAKSVKIIKDRDDRPKGFGYIEFEDLDGLKDALSKTGSTFSGRTIRVSVAEPPKERPFGVGGSSTQEDDSKFDSPWRRDGPLPDREASRPRRFEGPPVDRLPSVAEGSVDWRAHRPSARQAPEPEHIIHRRGSGYDVAGPGDTSEGRVRGSKFVPSIEERGDRFGSSRGRESVSVADEGDWRRPSTQSSISPGSSTPPTPQMGRKKLELLPRSGSASVSPSPLSSPRMAPAVSNPSSSRANPFGTAKPVDVSNKEREVIGRIEKEREVVKDNRLSMSRTSSRTGYERSPLNCSARTPPPATASPSSSFPGINSTSAEREKNANGGVDQAPSQPLAFLKPSLAPSVRPNLSFASAASARRMEEEEERRAKGRDVEEEKLADKVVGMVVV